MKPTHQRKPVQPVEPDRVLNRRWIALLVAALVIASLLGTSSFQTQGLAQGLWSKERRLTSAAGEIVAALKAYRAASPGTVKDFPLELADLRHDPRMLAAVSYLSVLPVDPTKSRLGRDTQRKKAGGRRAQPIKRIAEVICGTLFATKRREVFRLEVRDGVVEKHRSIQYTVKLDTKRF